MCSLLHMTWHGCKNTNNTPASREKRWHYWLCLFSFDGHGSTSCPFHTCRCLKDHLCLLLVHQLCQFNCLPPYESSQPMLLYAFRFCVYFYFSFNHLHFSLFIIFFLYKLHTCILASSISVSIICPQLEMSLFDQFLVQNNKYME